MHLSPTLIAAILRGDLRRDLLESIAHEHLGTICPVCARGLALLATEAALAEATVGGIPEPCRDPLKGVRRRLGLSERQLRDEVRTARKWLKRLLLKVPPESRRGTIRGAYKRYRGAVFGTLLLEEARRAIPADPAESLSLAEAALISCEATHPSEPDPQVRVPALAIRGNAQRALGHLPQAEVDLLEAVRLLDLSDLDDLSISAEIDFYLGSLLKDQGHFEEAGIHLTRAANLYPLIGDHQKAAATWLKLGLVRHAVHRFDDAIASAKRALALLDAHAEEWLVAYAHYNLAFFLHGKGEIDPAEAELDAHEALIQEADDGLRFRAGWLRARIAWSRGEVEKAETLFTETYRRAEGRGIPFDAGLVGLELARVHFVQGHTTRVHDLALQALGTFAEQKVEREARAAQELLDALRPA